jgi:hypothetical protein
LNRPVFHYNFVSTYILQRILKTKTGGIGRGRKKLQKKGPHNCYSLRDIKTITSERWVVNVVSISKMRERMETTKCQTETHEAKRLHEFLSKHR